MSIVPPLAAFFNDSFFELNVILQTILDGVSAGALYALLAVALVCAFRTSGNLNFAQGEMATLGAFLAFALSGLGLGIWPAMIAAAAVLFGFGAGVERVLVRPAVDRSWYASLVVILGVFLIVNSGVALIWGTGNRAPLHALPGGSVVLIHGSPNVYLTWADIGSLVVLALVVGGLWLLLNRSRFGLAYRAAASNRGSSELVGVPVSRMMSLGWGLAAAIGTVVGVLVSQQNQTLDFNLMLNVLVYGLAAACLGGFDSVGGAVVGGILLGVAGAVIPSAFAFVGASLSIVIAALTIFLVLMLRPAGLFGSQRVSRT
jgi:branched-chain amino acid transport system permease protein